MIRAFNYTRRKRIPRENVTITVRTLEHGRRTFDARLDLASLQLPADAHVYVEAYRRTSYVRFDFGTVAERRDPEVRFLDDLDATEIVFFRVKVIDRSGEIGK